MYILCLSDLPIGKNKFHCIVLIEDEKEKQKMFAIP